MNNPSHKRFHPFLQILSPLAMLIGMLLMAACSTATDTPSVTVSLPSSTPYTSPSTEITTLPQAEPTATTTQAALAVTEIQVNPPVQEPSPTTFPTPLPTARPTLGPDDWMSLPIIPNVSETARFIYQRGMELGRDPHAFSKVGDCQVATDFFLVAFDSSDSYYKLGEYGILQETIDWFSGSFARRSKSMRDAMRAESLFSSLFADPKECQPGEGPLACEYRLHNPSIAIISMEQTWGRNIDLEKYTRYMRQAIEYTISLGIVPILATKADNLEGDNQINRIIAQLAWEYDIPLWNFWAAVQPLLYHGLISNTPSGEADMYHLTAGSYYDLSLSGNQRTGWTLRNLTALQSLDAVWRGVSEP